MRFNNTTATSDQILCKWMLKVTHHKGNLLDFSPFHRSISSSLTGFPWKHSTRKPGVSSRRRWSRAKSRFSWKVRNISWCLRVSRQFFGTPDSKIGLAYWQRLLVLSRTTCQAHLPRTPFSSGKTSLTGSYGAFCWCLSHLRWCLTFILTVGSVIAAALASTALHSVLST